MQEPLQEIADRLRAHGLRATASRVAVLDVLAAHPGHPDAEAVREAVTARLGSISIQAVYDILHTFTDAGLLRRIEPAGHPARYEARVGDNHHHLICRSCGETRDVDCATGAAPCLSPGEGHGFAVDEAEVIFWGLCPRCRPDTTTRGTA